MRRILAGILAAATALSISVGAFAATSTVTVSSGSFSATPIKVSYSTDSSAASETSIKKLFTDISTLKLMKNLTEKLTIASNSVNGTPVHFTLRLKKSETSNTSPNILDYYNLSITDSSGNSVYNYVNESATAASAQYKDIELGYLNTHSDTSDSETYRIYITPNSELASKSDEADKIDWLLITDGHTTSSKASPTPTSKTSTSSRVSPTPTSKTSLRVSPTATAKASTVILVTPNPTATPVPTATPKTSTASSNTGKATAKPASQQAGTIASGTSSSGAKADELLFDKGTYTVGSDIPSGRYMIRGSDSVKIYNSNGELENNIRLVADNENGEGVAGEYVVLDSGDTVEIADYAVFTPNAEVSTARPTTRPTATPRTTKKPTATTKVTTKTTTKPSSTKKPTATPSSKTNPKTGDTAPIAAIAIVGIAALGTLAFIEYKKRKNH